MAYEKTTAEMEEAGRQSARSAINNLQRQGLDTYAAIDGLFDAANNETVTERNPAFYSGYREIMRQKMEALASEGKK